MDWILRRASGSFAEIPVPRDDGAAVAVNIGAAKLHVQREQSVMGTGGKGHRGQFHRAEVHQAVLRSRIAALIGGISVGEGAGRANGGGARARGDGVGW